MARNIPTAPLDGQSANATKLNRGRDFLRYLRTENIKYEGMPMTEIKEYFNTQYSTYIEQISPLENLPTFNSIFKAMHACKETHISESRFFTGPDKTAEVKRMTTKTQHDEGTTKPWSGGPSKKKEAGSKDLGPLLQPVAPPPLRIPVTKVKITYVTKTYSEGANKTAKGKRTRSSGNLPADTVGKSPSGKGNRGNKKARGGVANQKAEVQDYDSL